MLLFMRRRATSWWLQRRVFWLAQHLV